MRIDGPSCMKCLYSPGFTQLSLNVMIHTPGAVTAESATRDVGLNKAVATMQRGERSLIEIEPQYGYGSKGEVSMLRALSYIRLFSSWMPSQIFSPCLWPYKVRSLLQSMTAFFLEWQQHLQQHAATAIHPPCCDGLE